MGHQFEMSSRSPFLYSKVNIALCCDGARVFETRMCLMTFVNLCLIKGQYVI